MIDVLVIGAGIAGLSAAQALRQRGATVAVLEKSRGFGGRAASRTLHGTRVDLGAQFVTVRDARFAAQVDAWREAGVVREWSRGVPRWTAIEGWRHANAEAHPRYACPAGMNAIGKALADGLDVLRGVTIGKVRADGPVWAVDANDGRVWRAPRVVVTAPVPQALALLDEGLISGSVRDRVEAVTYAPCHAVAAGFVGVDDPPWPGVQLPEHPDLAWVANDTSRRDDRSSAGVTLVLHATPGYSRRRFDDPAETVVADLVDAVRELLPWDAEPTWTHHHRWRYAQPEYTLPEPALALAPGLALAGDAFGEGRVEGAYLSGLAVATLVGGSG
jgi:renalase